MSDFSGFDELARKLQSIDAKLATKVVRRGNARIAQVVAKEMKANAPVKTGTLKKSISYSNKRQRNGGFIAKVGAFTTTRYDGFYANFVEHGTDPHEIKARNKKSLSFSGRNIKSVNHPGSKRKPFIKAAFERSYKRGINESGRLMFKLLSEIA